MSKKYLIIKNTLLKQHEKIRNNRLKQLVREIRNDGYIKDPIIADENTMIILDGHHRYNSLLLLGLSSSPVYLC
ncbi:MAG: Transcriptional regulator [Candidatus Gottesmanbacteria bacterium GW2011_GWA2_41_12]|uniref:Transcriptional regulator n=1 Tax=Candidatus Gottesmanbacteria bacterium GW2011_GWA2_41_12 TaxID=1618440 RepID=A0A0G0WVT7_9BACT|nr:MAG: Transcriptional regulator [Candidatus Gottesmanbacteria bacterium GW2011_GWA2_41_12]